LRLNSAANEWVLKQIKEAIIVLIMRFLIIYIS
jgi:hypothetical protein